MHEPYRSPRSAGIDKSPASPHLVGLPPLRGVADAVVGTRHFGRRKFTREALLLAFALGALAAAAALIGLSVAGALEALR